MAAPTSLAPARIERISRTRRETIAAPAEHVFGLLSPVAEYDWIEGWSCEIVYPPSGTMEEGCTFHENMSAPFLLGRRGPTTWVVTRHTAPTLQVEFLLFLGRVALGKLAVTGEGIDSGSSAFSFAFTLTALSERSNRLVNAATAQRVEAMVGFLARALKHYCETGRMLGKKQILRDHGFHHGPRLIGFLRKLGLA